ncbi:hypothetical protein Goari_002906, partial [Gossypium aridum]|nr:hypothetical protein [Gossypium aridum]
MVPSYFSNFERREAYSFSHPFVEFITKGFLNPNQPLSETTYASVEAYHKSHGREAWNDKNVQVYTIAKSNKVTSKCRIIVPTG